MTDRTVPTEPTPCPVCGGKPVVHGNFEYGFLISHTCEHRANVFRHASNTEAGAIEAWNRRAASPAAPGAEVEPVAGWEMFLDESHFGMWCVRPKGSRAFGDGFHVVDKAEGQRLLTALSSPPTTDAIRAQARREALKEAAQIVIMRVGSPFYADEAHGLLAAQEILALAGKPGEAEWWRPTHQHVKRGTTYRVIGEAESQVSSAGRSDFPATARLIGDGDTLTVYQGEDGTLWARFTDEFNDGRFVALPAPPADGGGDGE